MNGLVKEVPLKFQKVNFLDNKYSRSMKRVDKEIEYAFSLITQKVIRIKKKYLTTLFNLIFHYNYSEWTHRT